MCPMPTKCTESLTQDFCEQLRKGHFAKHVCMAVGISEVTYYDWIKRGKAALATLDEGLPVQGEEPYLNFYLETRLAIFDSIDDKLGVIMIKDLGSGARWWLEKRCPDTYGEQRSKIDVTSNGEKVGPTMYYPFTNRMNNQEDEDE